MVPSTPESAQEQVISTMIELTRPSKLHRVIVAGSASREIYLGLHRRGYCRAATTITCPTPRGQHVVGLLAGSPSLQSLETKLDQLSRFLSVNSAIAILIDSQESGHGLKVHAMLEKLGFQIEAGVRCQKGVVLSAFRRAFSHAAKTA